ncbi:hypothetical protein M153_844000158, partial [Pseudoloma neurophilia]
MLHKIDKKKAEMIKKFCGKSVLFYKHCLKRAYFCIKCYSQFNLSGIFLYEML